MPRRIGVLGGMGPEATVLFQRRLIDAVPARDDADHIPLLVDMNPQVPSRIAHLIQGTGSDPAPVLAAMARRLEAAGAEALAMPCNTAHHYAGAIRAAVAIPLLDMVALSARAALAAAPGEAPVGLLASPAVRLAGLFERALAPRPVLWPEDEAPLLAAIRSVKAQGPSEGALQALRAASAALAARGATLQLVACTEFSLLAPIGGAGAFEAGVRRSLGRDMAPGNGSRAGPEAAPGASPAAGPHATRAPGAAEVPPVPATCLIDTLDCLVAAVKETALA